MLESIRRHIGETTRIDQRGGQSLDVAADLQEQSGASAGGVTHLEQHCRYSSQIM